MTDNSKVSIAIPILFTLLILSAVVSIVGNVLLLNTGAVEQSNSSGFDTKNWRIFKIVLSGILTLVFVLLTIFSSIEVFAPPSYTPKLITPAFEAKLQNLVKTFESWELLLILSNYIILPVGLAISLIDGTNPYIYGSIATIVIVYISYNSRMSTRNEIRRILPLHPEIKLADLGSLISKQPKQVKKQLFHLISFENFPARFEYTSDVILYLGASHQKSDIEQKVDVEEVTPPVSQTPATEYKGSSCPYCGEPAAVPNAKFCQECGSSIVSAK